MLLRRQRTKVQWHFIFRAPTYQIDVALKTGSVLAVLDQKQSVLHLQLFF